MISVVTITYNNFDELKLTLRSIEDLDGIERIVINGGSCQKTKSFLQQNQQIISISEPDNGIADAFNKGISLASKDAIVFLNSGDLLIDPGFLQESDDILTSRDDVDFVHANVIFGDLLCGDMEMPPAMCNLGRGMPYYHQTMVVRKRVFEKIGAFDLDYKVGMDFEFVCRMFKAGIDFSKGIYLKKAVVRMDGGGISATNEIKGIKECFCALRKNNLMSLSNLGGITRRYFFYLMRMLMLKVGLQKILTNLKIAKYKRRNW